MNINKILIYATVLFIMIINLSCEKEEFNELNQKLAETAQPGTVITDADLLQLPLSIQKYLRYCNLVGQPRHYNVKMKGTGEFKQSATDSWHKLDNSFYLMFKPACRF